MTKVIYALDDESIDYLKISGHANYSDHGSDIVCSSISTSIIISLNLVERLGLIKSIDYSLKEGNAEIKVKVKSDLLNHILLNLIDTLKDLEEEFPKNIKINCRRLAQ